jgi:protein phosphatase
VALSPQARYCPACGRRLPEQSAAPIEGTITGGRHIRIQGETLNLREIVNVVESGVRWWQTSLVSGNAVTRTHAAQAIDELSQILRSLSQQLAQGNEMVRITTRLPELRPAVVVCPTCGHSNRAGAKFCLGCGTALSGSRQPSAREPAMSLRLTIGARTDQGRVRAINQDSVFAGALALQSGATAYLCLVADGMGGAKAGEYASKVAAEVTRAHVIRAAGDSAPPDDNAWQELLRSAVQAANQRVYDESRADHARHGMGTTLTLALLVDNCVHIASVGDSRAYLMNPAGVTSDGASNAQLTSDHSLVARLVDIGQLTPEEARAHPQRNLLYRSIGTDPLVEVDTRSEQLEAGDVLLLCSDGLINHVADQELAQIALATTDPDRACEELVALANQRGGWDNITVVVVRVAAAGAETSQETRANRSAD